MDTNTKQIIIDTAKAMFNERGYNSVSIGDISNELGISKGNFTYYFKKKEDLMEAILNAESPAFASNAPGDIAELNAYFSHLQNVINDNSFYFLNHTQLAQLSNKIKSKQIMAHRNNIDTLSKSFARLEEKKLMRTEAFEGEYKKIIDTLMIITIYWQPYESLKNEIGEEIDYRKQMWANLYPVLTGKGLKELNDLADVI